MLTPYSDIRSETDPRFHAHTPARRLKASLAAIGYDWSDYTAFTTMRNPWDRVVSMMQFGRENPKSAWHAPAIESASIAAFCGHPAVVSRVRDGGAPNGNPVGPYNLEGFTHDHDGRQLVDRVLRIEDIDETLPALLGELGLPAVPVPRVNASQRGTYRDRYDDEGIARVAELFASDIAVGEYVF